LQQARDEATRRLASLREDNERLNRNTIELLRLRGAVAQLRRQLDLQRVQDNLGAKERPNGATHLPGFYISQEQITYAGYATPEAALETAHWILIHGAYEQADEALGPDLLRGKRVSLDRGEIESAQQEIRSTFKGMQILARKALAEDRVELKVKIDVAPTTNGQQTLPPIAVQPMVKAGDVWKLGGVTRGYQASWEDDGKIETYVP